MAHVSYIQLDVNEQTHMVPSPIRSAYNAQKVYPNCQHISPNLPHEDILKCLI